MRRRGAHVGGRRGLGVAALVCALGLGACGTAKHYADAPSPPTPVSLTVYVDNSHVSVSPARIGGGPVLVLVTNESSSSQDVSVTRSGGDSEARSSGTINSGATATIQTTVSRGVYEIRAGRQIAPARLTVTHERADANNALLQP